MIFQAAVSGSSILQALLVALFTALIGAVLAYVVGVRVTARWDERKRRREADLAALAEFYRLYGDFFTTWKLWNTRKKYADSVASPEDTQWALLQRAEDAEGGFEALLVKLVAERELGTRDIVLLGCFREGYQTLRETIRTNKALGWWASAKGTTSQPDYEPDDRWTGFQQYRAFKGLAEHFAVQLAKYPRRRKPSNEIGFEPRLLEVTDRAEYKDKWWTLAAAHLQLTDAQSPNRRVDGRREPGDH
jgi:hypothetical protein